MDMEIGSLKSMHIRGESFLTTEYFPQSLKHNVSSLPTPHFTLQSAKNVFLYIAFSGISFLFLTDFKGYVLLAYHNMNLAKTAGFRWEASNHMLAAREKNVNLAIFVELAFFNRAFCPSSLLRWIYGIPIIRKIEMKIKRNTNSKVIAVRHDVQY